MRHTVRTALSPCNARLRGAATGFLRDERAQDGMEYLLVGGAVAVALAIAFLAFDQGIPAIVGYVCPAVDTVSPVAVGACIH